MLAKSDHTEGNALLQSAAMPGYGQQRLFALARLQCHTFKAALRYQTEALSFLKHRCDQDIKLADDLLETGDFRDAFDVCAGFCQNAVVEYSKETARITQVGSKVASDTARQLRAEADAIVKDLAAQTIA